MPIIVTPNGPLPKIISNILCEAIPVAEPVVSICNNKLSNINIEFNWLGLFLHAFCHWQLCNIRQGKDNLVFKNNHYKVLNYFNTYNTNYQYIINII